MGRQTLGLSLVAMMLLSILSSGCMGLAIQREVMEDLREDYEIDNIPVDPTGWEHKFSQNECVLPGGEEDVQEVDCYANVTTIRVDQTVSKMSLDLSVTFEWSGTIGEYLGNNTDEIRFVEIMLRKPNQEVCWSYLATSTVSLEEEWDGENDCESGSGSNVSGFGEGEWKLEVRARGYAFAAPIDTLSFQDEFRVSLWVTKPCVRFPEIHDYPDCTPLSDMD
ncbi:MAG: hypothetical protein CMB58_005380 [Methanobacteriota archaeon]|nr:hypothetical protein [Euryarchaeota archaeon]RAH15523.1 MAG: hypothetical protein CMB58_005380 [Euryarchaeota archaeon]